MLPSHLRGRRLSVSPPLVAIFADGLVVGRVRRTDAVIALVMLSDVTPPGGKSPRQLQKMPVRNQVVVLYDPDGLDSPPTDPQAPTTFVEWVRKQVRAGTS
jgi:hypothetical protein